jgi:hypothetical protein
MIADHMPGIARLLPKRAPWDRAAFRQSRKTLPECVGARVP